MCHFNVIFSKLGGSGKDSSHKIVLERKKKYPKAASTLLQKPYSEQPLICPLLLKTAQGN